jgi:hypothetical protein
MRTRNGLSFVLAVVAPLLLVDSAQAYFHPGTGRFISRDPYYERGSLIAREALGNSWSLSELQFGFAWRESSLVWQHRVAPDNLDGLPLDGVLPTVATDGDVPGMQVYSGIDIHLYAYVRNDAVNRIDPLGLCTCTVQVRASNKSGSSPGLHLYVYFKRDGCCDDFTGAAHWGPCGFIGMCPKGSIDGKPYPPKSGSPGWGDDGGTPKGGPAPQVHQSNDCGSDPCTCLRDIMGRKYGTYLLLGPNSNSAAIEAAKTCGVDTSGITGYPGQGVSPGKPVSGR